MKRYNQLINITNIIFTILLLIMITNGSYTLYNSFMYMTSGICIIMIVINVIITIINYVKKQYLIAMLGTITSIVLLFANLGQVSVGGNIITLILAVINLFFTGSLEENSNSKVPFIIFCILNIIILFVIITPIIMNSINLKNIERAMTNLNENLDLEIYIKEEDNEYIFYDKKGKEINRIDKSAYGKIEMSLGEVKNNNSKQLYTSKFNPIVLGLNGNKVCL